MKKLSLILLITCIAFISYGQKKVQSPKSTVNGTLGEANVEIVYHQPSARKRKVMGELVPYGKVWRTGANNATTFSIDKDVRVEGKPLKAGTYSLFTIPGEGDWVVIFNKVNVQWGSGIYDQDEDALRVTVESDESDKFVETFTIAIDEEDVVMSWENTEVKFKVEK